MDLDIEALRLGQGRADFCSTVVLAWGSGDLGQLGLGDDRGRDHPTPIRSLLDKDIVHIAANDLHTAFLTGEGELYMAGNNDSGQLGVRVRESQLSPVQISALDTYRISHVACGQAHTIAVTDVGALVSWGAADLGQLGHGDAIDIVDVIQPRIVKGTRDFHFVRVACGAAHSLALTGSGEVYAFGQGTFGALGSGNRESSSTPIHIDELWGLGIIQIACGENHSAALSVDGQVFTWGRGKYGQLGHDSIENGFKPVQVKGLADQMIVQVICGGDHTMAINNEGKLFSWGRGQWGQTGLGTLEDILVPMQVKVLERIQVIQGSAGTRHSIVITKEGNVYGWGDGEQNQLGKTTGKVQLEPVLMSFVERKDCQLLYAVAAGEHTLAVFHPCEVDSFTPVDQRSSELISTKYKQEDGKKITLSRNSVDGILSSEDVNFQVTSIAGPLHVNMEEHIEITEAMKLLEGSCIIDVHGNGLKPIRLPILLKMLEGVMDSSRNMAIFVHAMEDIFSSVRFLTLSFKFQPSHWYGNEVWNDNSSKDSTELDGPGLDVLLIRDVYHRILQLYNPEILKKLCKSIMHLLSGIEKHVSSVPDSRWSRVLLIILQSPLIGEQGLGDKVSTQLFSLFDSIPSSVKSNMVQWLRTYPKDIFGGRFVRGIQKYISNRKDALGVRAEIPHDIASAVKVLSILNEANNLENLIPFKEFYNHAVCDNTSLKIWQREFMKWVTNEKEKKLISLCQVPFLLSPKAKSQILQVEADIYKQMSVQQSVIEQLFSHSFANPFLLLMVRRSDLIADTLRQLSPLQKNDYKKPLKVIFEGEEGVDEGGVTKEFFQILVRDLFHVDYGMFTYCEDTRNFWFNPNSMESDHEFWLVGAILGLAIYNGVILDVHFPAVIYKKLMELTPRIDDIKDFQPEVARSLQQLLEFEGDVASTFCLFFQVSYDYFGELRTYDLLLDGGDIPVTNENRQRYVDLYVRYLLCDSIQSQFNAFSNAFQQVCGGQALKLFRYEELELLICGLPHFDFRALERVAIYDGGYSKESQVIKWFWELVKEMSFEEKKTLLFFTTGNDRAPIGGLGSLRFIIGRNGDDTDRLPTAHTCFNILLIPEYSSKPKLENRLKLAISNSIGFGLQ